LKKALGYSKRGLRALLPLIAGYLLFGLVFDAFKKISFAIYPESTIINTILNTAIWFLLTAAIGVLISLPSIRKAALNWSAISPRFYLAVKFFLGNDEEQEIKYQEALFQLFPGRWKIGIIMNTISLNLAGEKTEFCVVMEPSVPVPFTGALHLVKKDDLIFTGKTIENTALTALSLGTKFNFDPDFLELKSKKDA